MDHEVVRLVFQLALILFAAKVGGEIFQRYLRLPVVLGEVAVGIAIGPFALGGIDLPVVGHMFSNVIHGSDLTDQFSLPLSDELWAIAQIGAIILLFMAGLETDLKLFLKYARQATVVAIGGVVAPFALGVIAMITLGFADGPGDVQALFVGAVLTATSIGISVRVLGDIGKLGTPEGVTILGAAVVDDVLGILALTVVLSLGSSEGLVAKDIGIVTAKTLGFWLTFTLVAILLSRHISSFLVNKFKVSGAALGLALALAFASAGLAESFGLAMIIGAFSIGLALSGTELAKRIHDPLMSVYHALVPIFFVVTGMLVDVTQLGGVLLLGVIITIVAIIGKVLGSGLPSLLVGFNKRGSWRIGLGMLPRGEVALIMAGMGISSGIIESDIYSVVILMTLVTTAIAPPLLVVSFRDNVSGLVKFSKGK